MIGIVELGSSDEITVYVVGGMSAAVHRYKGLGLVKIHSILRCPAYLLDQYDYQYRLSPGHCDGLAIKMVKNLNLMMRPVHP